MFFPLALAALMLAHDSLPTASPDSLRLALPFVKGRPSLDGKLDDRIWLEASRITRFTQSEPRDQAPPTQKSVAYVAYNDEFLFVGFRAYETDPGQIRATLFPRERGGESDDRVTLLIDTFLDRRRAFEFKVTPKGIQSDGIKVEGQRGDPSPDFVWYSAGQTDSEGWSAEIMIPWASLRFPPTSPLDIGFNIVRVIGRNGEKDSWAPRRRGNACDICQEGVLTGLKGIRARRTLDVLPYISGSRAGTRLFGSDSARVGGQFFKVAPPLKFSQGRPHSSMGGDFRLALSSSTVLNATVNPDFSQIEADDDQIRVNQRFTLFQQERRPFFLEAKDAFETVRAEDEQRTNLGDLFYSRAIVDPTEGVRTTSKRGGLTLASLYARDHAPAYFYYDGYESSGFKSVPNANADIGIIRARTDLLSDSYIGGMVLGRRLGSAENVMGSADFSLRRNHLTLAGEGALARDRAATDPAASRFLDGRTRSGKYYRLRLSRSGQRLEYSAIATGADSLFRDQLGRFARVGVEQFQARVGLSEYPNNRILQRIEQGIGFRRLNRFGGGLLDYVIDPRLEFQFQRQTSLTVIARREHLTIVGKKIDASGAFLTLKTDPVRFFGFNGNVYVGEREINDPANPRAGKGYSATLQAVVRPLPQASVEIRGQHSTHSDRWGSPKIADARIVRVKATYQATRALGVRLIQERSNQYNSLITNPLSRRTVRNSTSALMSLELAPASFLYAGYNEGQQQFSPPALESDETLRTDNQLFVKLSYLLRL